MTLHFILLWRARASQCARRSSLISLQFIARKSVERQSGRTIVGPESRRVERCGGRGGEMEVSNFASVNAASGPAGLRDVTSFALQAIADYWLLSPDEYLAAMGVNRQRLRSAEDIHKRCFNAIRYPRSNPSAISLAITARLPGVQANETFLQPLIDAR